MNIDDGKRSPFGLPFFLAVFFACLGQIIAAQAQSALDLQGRPVSPLTATPGKVVVLIFMRRDCPICSRYAPVIRQISAEHSRDASFWLVYPDKTDTSQEIEKYLKEYGINLPALHDPDHVLVKLAQAETTPEAGVFEGDRLVYHGRIDNWYAEFGRARPAATTHELSDAIEAARLGKSPAHRAVPGVGCYISDLE